MSALAQVPGRMSVAEFLAWTAPPGQLWQLVDGEPKAMAPASRTHGAIQSELARLIANALAERDSPCTVVTAPGVIPHVQSDTNVRIPDLAVTCSPYDEEEQALIDPVLLVERSSRQIIRRRPTPMSGPIRRFRALRKSSCSRLQ